MTGEEAFRLVRDAVGRHEPAGHVQWYVDDLVIDVSAEEFWAVVKAALAGR